MATRLRLPHPVAAGAPPVSPAFEAGWEFTDGAFRARLRPRRINSARAGYAGPHENSSGTQDVLCGQYVSDELAAQTFDGTVIGIIPIRESNASADARAQLVVKIVSNDGSTTRGILLGFDTSALSNELTTSGSPIPNVKYPRNHANTTLTPVDAQDGDRLVIEYGVRAHNNQSTNFTFTSALGDNVELADCANDESGTTGCPWLEFSHDIVWGVSHDAAIEYEADHTALSGNLDTAIANARAANADACLLSAGTWGLASPYEDDTYYNKILRVMPAHGLTTADVILENSNSPGTSIHITAKKLSLERVTVYPVNVFFQGKWLIFSGMRVRGFQLDSESDHITIDRCSIGGTDTGAGISGSYGILFSLTAEQPTSDVWILDNEIGNLTDRDCIEIRVFDHVEVRRNHFFGLIQGDPPDDHNDVFRTFLGGKYLVYDSNISDDNCEGQGFFINGGAVAHIRVTNNLFGRCAGSFRTVGLDDDTNNSHFINNSIADSFSWSNDAIHKNVVFFNNASVGGGISRVTGTSVNFQILDYNVLDATHTGITPGANDITTPATPVGVAQDDFRLVAASTGLDFGVEQINGIYAPTVDFNGEARSFPCEAGALERQPGDP